MKQPDDHKILRPSQERGYFDHGWLKTHHTFSFGDYYDPDFMGFHHLRVINEDYVEGGMGFGRHPHKDMEIFTYVLQGALEHKDSMGNTSVIKAGDVQKMTAGSGIFHSEFNHSKTQQVHLLQIWILPREKGLTPSYQQFSLEKSDAPLTLIGSPEGGLRVLKFHQDVDIYRGSMKAGQQCDYPGQPAAALWVQVISGSVKVSEELLKEGDGLGCNPRSQVTFRSQGPTEFLAFGFRS